MFWIDGLEADNIREQLKTIVGKISRSFCTSPSCTFPAFYEAASCTGSSDRVCEEVQTCKNETIIDGKVVIPTQFYNGSATYTSDTDCPELTECASTEFESVAPTGSTDRSVYFANPLSSISKPSVASTEN